MSLKQIATMCNTSYSTVSRVLNNPNHICSEPGLSEKIWAAARQINYLPNPAARELRAGTSKRENAITIDVLLTRFDSLDTDSFFRELYQSIKEEVLESQCLLGSILNVPDISLPMNSFEQKEKKGLIVLGKCPPSILPTLKKKYPYLVGIDRNPTNYEMDEIICNGKNAAIMAMEYLISLGHTRIAYIGDCSYETRYMGYYEALQNHNLFLDYNNIYPTGQTFEEGYQAYFSLLEKEQLPSAIFCANDGTALGVLSAMKKKKKRGFQPSIISIDNIKDAEKTSPLLTTINIPKEDMGHLAVSILLHRMAKKHSEYLRLELPCSLVVRDSCSYYHS